MCDTGLSMQDVWAAECANVDTDERQRFCPEDVVIPFSFILFKNVTFMENYIKSD